MLQADDLGQAPASVPAHIYAEFLPNIRSVSVSVALPSPLPSLSLPSLPETTTTSVSVSDDGTIIEIRYGRDSGALRLPVTVDPTSLPLSPPAYAVARDISIRLRPSVTAVQSLLNTCDVNYDPWSASALEDCHSLHCAECAFAIVEQDTVSIWKDLPSANWAEMMDFWHCHKPVDHKNTASAAGSEQKGYSANSAFSAVSGTCFVNTTSLLLSPQNCRTKKVRYLLKRAQICYGQQEGSLFDHRSTQCWGIRYNCPILKTLRGNDGVANRSNS